MVSSKPNVSYNVPVTIQDVLNSLEGADPVEFIVAYKTEDGVQVYQSSDSVDLAVRFAEALTDLSVKLARGRKS